MQYKSQYGQDEFVDNYFKNKTNGVFVDIGAHDGIHLSNTYFFEKYRKWKGICIEPNPRLFKSLIKNRDCICIEGAASDREKIYDFLDIEGVEALGGIYEKYDKRHLERIDRDIIKYNGKGKKIIEVKGFDINKILVEKKLTEIDYLSIDTEGGELEILKAIDYKIIKIKLISVEVNYPEKGFFVKLYNHIFKKSISSFLKSKGFQYLKNLDCDQIFIAKS
jgi:FkbM family methyltransferase